MIETASGRRYQPVNLAGGLRTDGLKVNVVMRDAPGVARSLSGGAAGDTGQHLTTPGRHLHSLRPGCRQVQVAALPTGRFAVPHSGGDPMTSQSLILFLVIGCLAGFLAGKIMKGSGFGLVGDLVVGVLGAFVGGWVFSLLGIAAEASSVP